MKRDLTVKQLIGILLEFNMDAYVKVNANGCPTAFDICWSASDCDSNEDTRKITDEVHFDVTQGESF